LVSDKWFRLNQYIPELGRFYKNVGVSWRVSEFLSRRKNFNLK